MQKIPESSSGLASIAEVLEARSDAARYYLAHPWAFAIGDPEERYDAIIGPEIMEDAATRPVLAFSPKQKDFLRDFCDLRIARQITKAGRGTSKTMCSSLGLATLAWCLPLLTATVSAGSLEQVGENYRYWRAFAKAPAMHRPFGPLLEDPMVKRTEFRNGGWLRILAASVKQARSPHPMVVVVDEATAADSSIILLTEGQLVGAPAPPGGEFPLYRIQSTPDTMFHLFKERWDKREELGYVAHEWSARPEHCPWNTEAHIAQLILEHDTAWVRINIDGEFWPASGTIWDYGLIQKAAIPTLQDDDLWKEVEVDMAYDRATLGVDWGDVHPTVIVVVVRVDGTKGQRLAYPERNWPQYYVVHVEGWSGKGSEFLYGKILAAATTWRADAFLDTNERRSNREVGELLAPKGLGARGVATNKYGGAMIQDIRLWLERESLHIPLVGQGGTLLQQMAEYSWDPNVKAEKPLKEKDDYPDALKFASHGQRGGRAGPAVMRMRPPGPRQR